jgi:hypothetical protein
MNRTKAAVSLAISAALTASLALADDFKTINGKEYKNVSVSRVEPDGIVIKYQSGISKVEQEINSVSGQLEQTQRAQGL